MKAHRPRRMARRMERHDRNLPQHHLFLIHKPMVWGQSRHIRDPEYPTLELEVVPQLEIILMQTNRRTGRLLDLAGRQKVIEMGVRMEDAADGKAQLLYFLENSLRCTAGIDDDCLLRDRI